VFNKPFVKKFLYIYLSAVALVLLYFLFKTLFIPDTEITPKSFEREQVQAQQPIQEQKPTQAKEKFLLLP